VVGRGWTKLRSGAACGRDSARLRKSKR
jgi:hypothetical protein